MEAGKYRKGLPNHNSMQIPMGHTQYEQTKNQQAAKNILGL